MLLKLATGPSLQTDSPLPNTLMTTCLKQGIVCNCFSGTHKITGKGLLMESSTWWTSQALLCRLGLGSLRVEWAVLYTLCVLLCLGSVVFPLTTDQTTVYKSAGITENRFFRVAGSKLGKKLLVALSVLHADSFKSISAAVTPLWLQVGIQLACALGFISV